MLRNANKMLRNANKMLRNANKMLRNATKCYEMLRNATKCYEMLRNTYATFLITQFVKVAQSIYDDLFNYDTGYRKIIL
jgi:hypothetical protein